MEAAGIEGSYTFGKGLTSSGKQAEPSGKILSQSGGEQEVERQATGETRPTCVKNDPRSGAESSITVPEREGRKLTSYTLIEQARALAGRDAIYVGLSDVVEAWERLLPSTRNAVVAVVQSAIAEKGATMTNR